MQNRLIIGVLIILSFTRCTDEPLIVIVHTGLVKSVSEQGALLTGSINKVTGSVDIDEFGFAWSQNPDPTMKSSFYRAGTTSHSGTFEQLVQSDLQAGKTYFVRAYAIQAGNVIYGEPVKFISQGSTGPGIVSFDPVSGSGNVIITIRGSNFSYNPDNNEVRIGPIMCKVISATDEELKVQVPTFVSTSGKFKVSVKVGDQVAVSVDSFTLDGPYLSDVAPLSASEGTLITITGSGFSATPSSNLVKFGTTVASVVTGSPNQLVVIVPHTTFTGNVTVSVKVNNITGQFETPFTIEGSVITSVNPTTAYGGSTLTISGKNFSTVATENEVTIGGAALKVLQANTTQLLVEVPYYFNSYPQVMDVAVTVFGKTNTLAQSFTSKTPWSYAQDYPGAARNSAASFAIDGVGYVGTGSPTPDCSCFLKDFWAYHPTTDSWERKANFGGTPQAHAIGFSLNGKGYLGGGTSLVDHGYYFSVDPNYELWKYDPANNQWTRMNNLPTGGEGKAFTVGNRAFLLTGATLYEYDVVLDQWNFKSPYPGFAGFASNTIAFELNGKGYVSEDDKEFYEYDPALDQWTRRADFPAPQGGTGFASFAANGRGYAGSGSYIPFSTLGFEFYRYDPVQDQWQEIPSVVYSLQQTISFTLNGVPFFGIGRNATNGYLLKLNSDF